MGKTNFLIRSCLSLLSILITLSSHPQSPLQSISKTYFRTDPFATKFSSFIASLQKDPWFTITEFSKRTDSTFFFLSGHYKNFNPFHFIPKEVRLVIAEDELVHSDTLQSTDTIINVQLMAITDSANSKFVQQEFRRFYKNQSRRFASNKYKNYKQNAAILSETYHYFLNFFSIAPLTIVWGRMPASGDYTFTIIMRFKVQQNEATYILAPGEPIYKL